MGFHHPEQDKELALKVVAWCGGNTRAAARAMKGDENLPSIARGTIDTWVRSDRDRYMQIRQQVLPQIHGQLAESFESFVTDSLFIGQQANARLKREIPNLEPRDLSTVVRNAAVSAGIGTEKALLLNGDPTHIIGQKVSTAELASELARLTPDLAKALGVLVEDNGEPIDAEVVDDDETDG